jgi:uncharacterized protein YprB with RNaseH-like and TPR domain
MEVSLMLRACAFCQAEFETTDARKVFCNKQHADRSRNLPKPQPGAEGKVELEHFNKFPTHVKKSVLLGEAGHKIVGFDLECTSLKPNVGRIICCSFKPLSGGVYTFGALDRRFRKPDVYDDGALAKAIRDELEKYDLIMGWNSKNFDVKFLNSRLLRAGHRTKTAQHHVDGMWSFRSKASAWSKLDTVHKFLPTERSVEKTSVEWEKWMRVLGWDKKLRESAMASIVDHCEKDVIVLEEVFQALVHADVIRSLRRDGGIL